ncbi:glycosyl hydrolase family 18 protein [Ramlibacter humi]|nr:glycoside hydrolase family 18 protein [Ramlibacter humi]
MKRRHLLQGTGASALSVLVSACGGGGAGGGSPQAPAATPDHVAGPAPGPSPGPGPGPRLPWVTAYYAGYFWQVGELQQPQYVDMTAMTHYVFARCAPGGGSLGGAGGDLVYGAGTAAEADNPFGPGFIALGDPGNRSVETFLLDRARAAGTKALLMVGGMGDGAGWELSTNAANRARFVGNLLDYLDAHGYDGVDIDWEDNLDTTACRDQLRLLLQDLRAASPLRARWASSPLIITFPGYALNMNTDAVEPWKVEIASLVDQYNLMSYGMAYDAPGWATTFFCAIGGETVNTPMDLETSIAAYVAAGVPADKLGIGIGFYGIAYPPPLDGPRQLIPPGVFVESNDLDWCYRNMVARGYLSAGTEVWDSQAQMHYRSYPGGFTPAGGGYTAGMTSYEDPASIAAKGAWVRSRGLGGAIVWLVNYGTTDGVDNPLMDAVKAAFR